MKQYNILIIENDEDEQFFMKEGFDASGLFHIKGQLSNGDELVQWLEEHPSTLPDIILSDLNMPGKNGYDILDFITASPVYGHIPVIITSTSSTKSTIEKCMNKGAADYLVKPDTFIEYGPYVKRLHQLIEEKDLVK